MSDLWMALVAGLLGSTHCIGMCGGFAVALAVSRQHVALYHTGRVLGYAALGALAGALGQALNLGGAVLGVRRLPLFLAAGFLIVFGLAIAGVLPQRWVEPGGGGVQRLLGALLRRRDRRAAFLFGMANALLPCGLLYPVYALAAAPPRRCAAPGCCCASARAPCRSWRRCRPLSRGWAWRPASGSSGRRGSRWCSTGCGWGGGAGRGGTRTPRCRRCRRRTDRCASPLRRGASSPTS